MLGLIDGLCKCCQKKKKKERRGRLSMCNSNMFVPLITSLRYLSWQCDLGQRLCGTRCQDFKGSLIMSRLFLFYYLWHKKEVKNEIRDSVAPAGSNTAITVYCTSNVIPPVNLFLSQYEIQKRLLLHLINCLYNISLLLLFQVTVGLYKLAC